MRRWKEIKVSTGEYTNGQGEQKKSYAKIGVLFKDDQDPERLSIKLDVLPMGQIGNDGKMNCWLSVFEPYKEDGQAQPQQPQAPAFGSAEHAQAQIPVQQAPQQVNAVAPQPVQQPQQIPAGYAPPPIQQPVAQPQQQFQQQA